MKTKNIKKEIKKDIEPFLKKLKKQDYVIGIVLLGGVGKRGFIDEFSDIDLTIFTLKKDALKLPLPFEFHHQINKRILEFNIHQQILENEERAKSWDESKIEAYSRGKIFYDPTGRIRKLIENKTKFNKEKAFNRLESTSTGFAPARIIAATQEIMVNVGKTISSPAPIPNAAMATSNATEPLLTAIPCLRPTFVASDFSNFRTKIPSDEIQPVSMHSARYFFSLPSSKGSLTGINSTVANP